jgi:hypothetical protein
VRKTEKVK